MSENVAGNDKPREIIPLAGRPFALSFLICAGVLLPLIALGVELYSKLCAEILFDPIPTLWHVLLVGFVPLSNSFLIWSLYKNRFERISLLGWASAFSTGIALFYSIIFAPVSPLAVIGILYVGFGLLPLSPMFALWAVMLGRKYVLQNQPSQIFPFRWVGLSVMLLLVIGVVALSEAKFIATRYGLAMASSENVERQEEGIRFLRKYGDEYYIVNLAGYYRHRAYISDVIFNLFSSGQTGSYQQAQEVFYRLKGKTAEEVGEPRFGFEGRSRWEDERLNMVASQMDGSIDNDASLGYLEWTFTFKNTDSWGQKEAFGQIQLPPDAVVSRLTLWINGEEREAAFAEKQRVTQAYNAVTAKKRDPVLVTTAGRDRINMKCFPIEPNGGEMKVRIGITFPLILENEKSGLVRLPYFRDKNFKMPDITKHIVWLESKKELQSANKNLKYEQENNVTAIRGNITDKELIESISSIRAVKSDEFKSVWAKDEKGIITQTIEQRNGVKPTRYIFVVDTSANFKSEKENVVAAIQNLPAETEVGLVLTHGNALNTGLSFPNSIIGSPAEIAEKIKQAEFDGGTDNLPALTRAWDLAAEKEGSVVIWTHAPQPYKFSSSNGLAQRIYRRPNKTEIFSISNANGLDVIEKELDDLNYLKNAPRFSDLKTDVERLISQLNQSQRSFNYIRTNVEKADLSNAKETSKHLIRLWANDEVNRILAVPNEEKKAVELAQKYQLVTPVTGAVVLETQQQYDQFGLNPVDKNSVPTIPEPETYLLIAVVLGVFLWLMATRKLF